jgi:glucose-1-phosphate adenylyltransferase
MNRVLAMILAGGVSRELPVITAYRSKAALPYGGRYRVIDFCLSNCANSGINQVGILAQYNPASLIAHIGNGQPWDLNRHRGGIAILQPYTARAESNWFRGTADALWQHLRSIEDAPCDDVLVLSADQIYKMDYYRLIEAHRYSGSWVTIAARHHARGELERYGALEIDEDGIVRTFIEKPESHTLRFVSLGIYAFKKEVLLERLRVVAEDRFDIVFDVLLPLVREGQVRAHLHNQYWADIGWIQQFYDSSMGLLRRPPCLDLDDSRWPIYTKTEIRPPSHLGRRARVGSALIANGCRIEGTVRGSILFPGVTVEPGATISDSIVFSDTVIGSQATVDRAVIDKKVKIGRKALVGFGNVTTPNSRMPEAVSSGITVVGKGTAIPDEIRIGRNCLIGGDLTADYIPKRDIVCGETISSEERWQRISS